MSARERILARIREHSGRSGETTAAEMAAVQSYLKAHPPGPLPPLPWEDNAARFRERCLLLESSVGEVARREDVPGEVARFLRDKQLPARLVAWPEFADLPWSAQGIACEARPPRADDLTGLTGCFCAIAETGTLVFISGPQTATTTSLLPETHIAVVPVSRIVRTMEDAWTLLRAEEAELPRAVHLVSGPSRTADIEQTIVIGVHGPYRVHVVLVREEPSRA